MFVSRTYPVIAVLLLALLAAMVYWVMNESAKAIDDSAPTAAATPLQGAPVEVEVKAGENPRTIGKILEDNGVIDSAAHFRSLVSLLGYEGQLQAGNYEFDPETPALTALYRIRRGIVSARSVTVIEGRRLEEVAEALENGGIEPAKFIDSARAADFNFDFLEDVGPGRTVEGFLFPSTYSFRAKDTPKEIIQQMLATFDERVPGNLRSEAAASGLNMFEVITLASIVEREAAVPEDRAIIAQVFLLRLELGMMLDADPTVQYAVAEDEESVRRYGWWKKELTAEDLQSGSPYNTYRRRGLPPGPICNPGLDSIVAVIRPATTDFLYFVAKPDGSHAFAETLSEHQENVDRYAR